jgi:septal ring factor EnvC (AmiA/AmiB activator)
VVTNDYSSGIAQGPDGQWLLAGEPVGVMGPATNGNPELYFELRHDGQPIDPSPWLGLPDPKKE